MEFKIRRPRPSPRQGRRLGPPQVWNLSFLATGIPRPHPWLFMGVQACRLPALKRSKPLKPLKGHFHGFLWASSAGKSYPKARSIAVSGRSSVPFARHSQPTGIRPLQWLLLGFQRRLPGLKPSKPLKPLTGHFNGFLWASSAGKSPHPWLFMGVQACRLPGLKPSKPLKPLKGHFNGFLWASSAGKSPHPWLFMGVQACRLPGLKPSKPLKPPKRPLQWLLMGFQRRQKPTSMAFYGRPSLPFARPKTLQTPKTPKRPGLANGKLGRP